MSIIVIGCSIPPISSNTPSSLFLLSTRSSSLQIMTASGSNNGGGCFSGIARLLLCIGSLQTHPSDEIITPKPISNVDHIIIKGSNMANSEDEAPVLHCNTTPGVVARLMGLDSFPEANWIPKSRRSTPDLVSRSRSVNFMEFLADPDLELKQIQNQKHRRVWTSVSFREVPDKVNQQDLNFSVFVEKSRKHGYRMKKSEANLENVRQRTAELERNNKIGYAKRRNVENVKQKLQEKKANNKMNLKAIERRTKPVVSNERRTPRFGSCKGGGQVSSGFVSARKKDGIPVRKVKNPVKLINQKEVLVESKFMKKVKSQPFSENKSSPKSTNFINKVSTSAEGVKHNKRVTKNGCIDEVGKLIRLTEGDMKGSKWAVEFENTEVICLYFGEQILDLLLKQVVEELMED